MDRKKLMEFRDRYPGIRTRDIQSLLEKSKDQQRVSIMKNPSKELIFEYYSVYPDKDASMDKLLEKILYADWKQSQKIKDAEVFLMHFPNAEKSDFLREWLVLKF